MSFSYIMCDELFSIFVKKKHVSYKHGTQSNQYGFVYQDFLSTQEKLSRAEAQCHHLNTEKELLRSSEQRLMLDIDNLRREKTSQSMLMANLQSIQASLS